MPFESTVLVELMRYIYIGDFQINNDPELLVNLLSAAEMLEIRSLVDTCISKLAEIQSVDIFYALEFELSYGRIKDRKVITIMAEILKASIFEVSTDMRFPDIHVDVLYELLRLVQHDDLICRWNPHGKHSLSDIQRLKGLVKKDEQGWSVHHTVDGGIRKMKIIIRFSPNSISPRRVPIDENSSNASPVPLPWSPLLSPLTSDSRAISPLVSVESLSIDKTTLVEFGYISNAIFKIRPHEQHCGIYVLSFIEDGYLLLREGGNIEFFVQIVEEENFGPDNCAVLSKYIVISLYDDEEIVMCVPIESVESEFFITCSSESCAQCRLVIF
jgi:hypothetical protein